MIRRIPEIISSLLILLLLYAAISKLMDYSTFKLQLGQSPFISDYSGLVSWSVPAGEIIISLLLTFPKTRLIGLYASLFIMVMFSSYIYLMLRFSYYVPCSCGGILSKMTWNQHLWFNLGFVALNILAIHVSLLTPKPFNKEAAQRLAFS